VFLIIPDTFFPSYQCYGLKINNTVLNIRKSLSLDAKVLADLPGEIRIVASEVSVGGSLAHHGATELEVADNAARAKVEVLANYLTKLSISLATSLLSSAIAVNKDRKGVGDTDGITELDKSALAESSVDKTLGDPTSGIGSRPIDLGGVLSRESTSSMGSPATIGINDDLPSGESSVSVGSTNDEAARGVKVVDGLVIEVLGRDDGLNNMLHQVLLDLVVRDGLVVLGGDDNGVHANRDGDIVLQFVLNGDLGLAIRADPVAGAVLADFSEAASQLGGKHVGEGHEGRSLVGSISEHDSLVSSADVLNLLGINRLGNVGGLLLDGDNDIASLVVKSLGGIVIADVLDGIANDLLVVNGGRSGNLSKDHDHASLGASLAGNTAALIILDAGIKNSIRHLIAKLVRVSLVDRLRRLSD